ncbi:MAG: type IV pilus twitching motility protein PilT [Candidatus Paceibacterota bacterium]
MSETNRESVQGIGHIPTIKNPLTFNDDATNSKEYPKITARALVEYLIKENVLTETDLIGLLGETRHHLTVTDLQKALIKKSVLSDAGVSKALASSSGYLPLLSTKIGVRGDLLDEMTASQLGAVVLDTDKLTVALVEDKEDIINKIIELFGKVPEIAVATTGQFTELFKIGYKNAGQSELEPLGDIYGVFDEAVRTGASDIHLSVGVPPTLRVHGKIKQLPYENIDNIWMRSEVARIAGQERLAKLQKKHDVDLAFPYGLSRFRVNFGADRHGWTMAARKIPTRIPTMEELNLPKAVQQFSKLDRGLVLVTGPTGSGKSTTLASLLAWITTEQDRHVITLEDPIEFLLPEGRGVVHQRELGSSFTSFPDGLRQALRQDPDVILVGEMRDLDTIKTAVTAAETGHLVFGTLHTFDAASTVSRITAMYPTDEQEQIRATLSYTLKGIVSQSLLRTAAGSGRVAAFEVMVTTAAIANNLRRIEGTVHLRSSIETGVKDGMQTMDMALVDLVKRRIITEEEALEKVVQIDDFQRRMKD